MKKILFLALLAALVLTGASFADAGEWTGEVLDLNCYESRGAKGEGHASCAVRCLNGGSPMGLLVDGDVVYVDTENSDAAALKTMKDLGGKMAWRQVAQRRAFVKRHQIAPPNSSWGTTRALRSIRWEQPCSRISLYSVPRPIPWRRRLAHLYRISSPSVA